MVFISHSQSLYELPKFRSRQRRETIFLMRTTTTTMTTTTTIDDDDEEERRETRSKFEAEDGGGNEVTRGKFGRVYSRVGFVPPCILYISRAVVASAAAAAAAKKLPKRTKEKRNERWRKRKRGIDGNAQPNIIIQRAEKRRFRVEISWEAKSKLVFVHYTFARLRRRPN